MVCNSEWISLANLGCCSSLKESDPSAVAVLQNIPVRQVVNGPIGVLIWWKAIPWDTEDHLTVMGISVIRLVVDYEHL